MRAPSETTSMRADSLIWSPIGWTLLWRSSCRRGMRFELSLFQNSMSRGLNICVFLPTLLQRQSFSRIFRDSRLSGLHDLFESAQKVFDVGSRPLAE